MDKIKIGTKIRIIESYHEYYSLRAKKGSIAMLESYEPGRVSNMARVKLNNGESVLVPESNIEVYAPKKRETVATMSNEDLVKNFGDLITKEAQSDTIRTKTYQKLLKDINKHEVEILRRLNNK